MVVPKKEVDYIFDLEDSDFTELQLFSKKVARAIKQVISCKRIGVAVIGLEVPHAHIHLVPMNNTDDLNFTKSKLKPSKEQLEEVARKISEAFLINN